MDRLIRSARKSLSVEITSEGEVVVRAPLRMSQKEIDCFLESRRHWIEQHRQLALARPKAKTHRFAEGEGFYFLGNKLTLTYCDNITDAKILEQGLLVPSAWRGAAGPKLVGWYRRQAERILLERLHIIEEKTGLKSAGFRITSAKKRWGSCSGRNCLCFAWYLVMAPAKAIDAVIVHELCHTVHHDHSNAFWSLIYRIMPEYPEQHRWLQENRGLLRLDWEEGCCS